MRRTAHGVPHIYAQNLAAAGYAEAYVQSEDYGARVALSLLRARGEVAKWYGRDSIAGDFAGRQAHAEAFRDFAQVDADTRQVYEGFAAGVNRYVELHPEEFPTGFAPHFTAYDVLAKDVEQAPVAAATRALNHERAPVAAEPSSPHGNDDDGSNAWAFAPSRTTSGHAILLRNPHLVWTAGYYEAHVVVPGVLDFYGDLRIGGPFEVIGGFNRDLGWATTNNYPTLWQVYSLSADSTRPDHYWLDGESKPLEREVITVQYRDGDKLADSSREVWRTTLGPVIGRKPGVVYVVRSANEGDFRGGEQFLRMMRAHSLAEWQDAMRMRARTNSSFTYADRAGNIYYLWNAAQPSFAHATGGDSVIVPVTRTAETWTHYVPFDSLPQFLNPAGGYVQNENDGPYLTNLHQPLDPHAYPWYYPPPDLSPRSQLALTLIDNDRRLSLEDVIAFKHSYRMLMGERLKSELVAAVRASNPSAAAQAAANLIEKWDGTSAPDSRGGVLFEAWYNRYVGRASRAHYDSAFTQPWSIAEPITTPRGIRDPKRAAEAFAWAVDETTRRFGAYDVAWGDVHRVRRGNVDVPVGGCAGPLGCFRVLVYKQDPDGKLEATGSDGWILAVEFGDEPRVYSVLAYGESPRPDSPWFADQAEMFARGELKPVAWTTADIAASTVRSYHPGATK